MKKWIFREDIPIHAINGLTTITFKDAENRLNYLESQVQNMKSKEDLLQMLFATLAELQNGTLKGNLKARQQARLELLYDILGEEVPKEYWEQIENEI